MMDFIKSVDEESLPAILSQFADVYGYGSTRPLRRLSSPSAVGRQRVLTTLVKDGRRRGLL